MGSPRIGSKELLEKYTPTQGPEVLGVVKDTITDPSVTEPTVGWASADGSNVDMQEPPPPWVLEDKTFTPSDARRYVDVPANWVLRWINPRLLEQNSWGYWKPVLASDPKVTVKVESMVAPDGNVRRGGFATGDILSWMYRGWYDGLKEQQQQRTNEQTANAVRKQQELFEEFKRLSPFLHVDHVKHPTHTMGEGRTMRDL